jgi:hypothetical protein
MEKGVTGLNGTFTEIEMTKVENRVTPVLTYFVMIKYTGDGIKDYAFLISALNEVNG